jgi:hypothetical protein
MLSNIGREVAEPKSWGGAEDSHDCPALLPPWGAPSSHALGTSRVPSRLSLGLGTRNFLNVDLDREGIISVGAQ